MVKNVILNSCNILHKKFQLSNESKINLIFYTIYKYLVLLISTQFNLISQTPNFKKIQTLGTKPPLLALAVF